MDRAKTLAVLDELSSQPGPKYHVGGCLHVGVCDDTEDLPILLGWEQDEIEPLERILGHRPDWCVLMDLSWIVDAPPAAERLVLALLQDGGAAKDDYSYHMWTAEEISENRLVEGQRFGYPVERSGSESS